MRDGFKLNLVRGVHKLGRVRFVLDLGPTWIVRVGENQNRNRPVLMVRSSGLGLYLTRARPELFEWVKIKTETNPY